MTVNSSTEPYANPGIASAEEGQVILEGPDGFAITMTPDAAVATGRSLIEAGEQAREQDPGVDRSATSD